MLTEWVLVVWFVNSYPMGGRGWTAPVVVDRFNTYEECAKAGNNWILNQIDRDFDCIKSQKTIDTKE